MSDEWITESEARLRMAGGVPVDRSKIIRPGESAPDAEVDDTPEDDTPEEAPEDDTPEEANSDKEWEVAQREAGADPDRDELEEANVVLESNPVADLKGNDAKEALEGLTALQLTAVVENDSRKTVQQAASELLSATSE